MRPDFLLTVLTLIAFSAVSGCSKSTTLTPDAGIQFDATPPDATVMSPPMDAMVGPGEGMVGAPCSSDRECDGELCLDESDGFRDGYCSQACDRRSGCPDGAACVQVGRGLSLCFQICDPDADRDCRPGYGCADSFRIPDPVCLPGCSNNSDCPEGMECNPEDGFANAGECFSPDAPLGDACTTRGDCPADAICLEEEDSGWPRGACLGYGCDPDSNSGCPDGANCLPTERGGGLCVADCETDDDCREAYTCRTSGRYPDRRYCGPACTTDDHCTDDRACYPGEGLCTERFDETELGEACSTTRGACEGGTCLREYESGFPGSYCIYLGCDPAAADDADGCPGDGVCFEKDGTSYCLDGCASDDDCRAGYACNPRDPMSPDGPSACTPACTSDTVCANRGFVCNPGTGLCTPSFAPEALGDACSTPEDCPGGACATEDEEGWPNGACVYPGCRLSGDGPSVMCPMGAVCIDDERDDPEIGVCITGCDPSDPSACRSGYACSPIPGGAANGCLPQCTADSECDPGRTCNMMSGLCG